MTVALETRSGEAGHSGTEVRSDLHVHIEPRDRGGIAIELQSRVKPYYGDSIQRQAEEVLEALGVRHAQVQIHDEGALPFVIAARIEAAVKRAGWGQGTRVLPDRVPLPEASSRDRLRRSRLYVPGQRAQVLHQRSPARTRCNHPRPGRFSPPWRERCCPLAGSQCAACG